MPAWLARLFGLPSASAKQPIAEIIGDQVFNDVEGVEAFLAKCGVPWAGTAEDLTAVLKVGFDMVQRGVITPGQPDNPDGGHHGR